MHTFSLSRTWIPSSRLPFTIGALILLTVSRNRAGLPILMRGYKQEKLAVRISAVESTFPGSDADFSAFSNSSISSLYVGLVICWSKFK